MGAMTGPYLREKPLERILRYRPETDEWAFGPEIPEGRRRGSAGVVYANGAVYVFCGSGNRGGSPELTSMERLFLPGVGVGGFAAGAGE